MEHLSATGVKTSSYQHAAQCKNGIVSPTQDGDTQNDAKEQLRDRIQIVEKEQQSSFNSSFEKFKARIDAEKHEELASLALQRNVSLKSRRAKLQSFLNWIGGTQKEHQQGTRTIKGYIAKHPSAGTKGGPNNESPLEFQVGNGNNVVSQMLPFERPKSKRGHLAQWDKIEGEHTSYQPDKSIEIFEAKQILETDFSAKDQQLTDAEQVIAANKKPVGKQQESKFDNLEESTLKPADEMSKMMNMSKTMNMAKENQALQHNARAITEKVINEALAISYDEEIRNCRAKIEELYSKITEGNEERKVQIAKDKLQEQEMTNLQQKLEKIQQAYEENLVRNRQLRDEIRELRREKNDSQLKLLDERATRTKHQATYRLQMIEMEKHCEQMQCAKICLEREIEKLEFQCILDERKINKLELQVQKLDDRLEQKDLAIEQLIRNRRKRGFLTCF